MRSFCRKNHVRKISLFWGGFLGGGGSAGFIFMGARIFLIVVLTALVKMSFFLHFSFLGFGIDSAKTPKTKNAEKKDKQKIQLAQLCSQIVFLIFGGGVQNFYFCWKHYKNRGLSIFRERKKAKH